MIVGWGLGILDAPGIVFLLISGAILDAFRKHFGSLGGVLDDTGASLSLLGGGPGDPWELQESIFFDFGCHFGCPWEVIVHVFSL